MVKGLFRVILIVIAGLAGTKMVLADGASPPGMTPVPDTQNLVSDLGPTAKKPGSDTETIRLLDAENHKFETHENGIFTYQKDQSDSSSRAQQMVKLIQDQQFQKAMQKITQKGNTVLEDNPGLKTPASVIAGAAALWYGRTVKLLKSEQISIFSRIEARNRSGEFSMQSPLLNSSLQFHGDTGMDLNINRRISSIDTSAQINYNMKSQSMGTQINHTLIPHLDFTLGRSQSTQTNQPDNRAGLQYQLNF